MDRIKSSSAASNAAAELARATIPKIASEIKLLNQQAKESVAREFDYKESTAFKGLQREMEALSIQEKKEMIPYLMGILASDEARAKLGLPKLVNMSNAEYSLWKQEVAPYLGDVSEVAHSAASAYFLRQLSQPVRIPYRR